MRDRNIARFPTLVRLAPFKFEARLARSGKQHPCRFPGSLVTWRSRPHSQRSLSGDRLGLQGIIWDYLVTYLKSLNSSMSHLLKIVISSFMVCFFHFF